jgi:hypothetical protein
MSVETGQELGSLAAETAAKPSDSPGRTPSECVSQSCIVAFNTPAGATAGLDRLRAPPTNRW